jgi:hypothetical protein
MFSAQFWEAVWEGRLQRRKRGRKGRQNAHYTQACQFPFFISLSVFVTELLINRKRLPEGMRQVQGDWTADRNSG